MIGRASTLWIANHKLTATRQENLPMATHEILGIDPYREGASIAFGVPYNRVTNSQRTLFKEGFALFACGLEMSRQMGQENIRAQVKRVARMMRLRGGV
jgi:hypothetical protein